MGKSILLQNLFGWVLALAIGLPILIIILGEVAERLERQGSPFAQSLQQIRVIVLPTLTLLLIVRQVLGLASSDTAVKMTESFFWVTVVIAALSLLSNLIKLGEMNTTSWVSNVPVLFFAFSRALVVFLVLYYIFSTIWQIDISSLVTALGVGSLVIAFALQNTLSNLVSGFLLVLDRPFKVGDWLRLNDKLLQVKEVNWRAARLQGLDKTIITIPNDILAGEIIQNYGQSGTPHRRSLIFGFSYNDSPNRVKKRLIEVLLSVPEVMKNPAPEVRTHAYGDSAIEYQVLFSIDFKHYFRATDEVKTRVFYAAQRYNFNIPYPIQTVYWSQESDTTSTLEQLKLKTLRTFPFFHVLDQTAIDSLVAGSTLEDYGVGEQLVKIGEPDKGLYLIQSGRVVLSINDKDGQNKEIYELSPGHFFGEMVLLRDEPSPVSVIAIDDLTVLTINHTTIVRVMDENPKLALEMGKFIKERKKVLAIAMGGEDKQHVVRSNGWLSKVEVK